MRSMSMSEKGSDELVLEMARGPRRRQMEAEVWQVEFRDGFTLRLRWEAPLEGAYSYLACEEGGDQGRNNGVSAFTAGKNLTAHIPIPATGKGELAMVHKTLMQFKKGNR